MAKKCEEEAEARAKAKAKAEERAAVKAKERAAVKVKKAEERAAPTAPAPAKRGRQKTIAESSSDRQKTIAESSSDEDSINTLPLKQVSKVVEQTHLTAASRRQRAALRVDVPVVGAEPQHRRGAYLQHEDMRVPPAVGAEPQHRREAYLQHEDMRVPPAVGEEPWRHCGEYPWASVQQEYLQRAPPVVDPIYGMVHSAYPSYYGQRAPIPPFDPMVAVQDMRRAFAAQH